MARYFWFEESKRQDQCGLLPSLFLSVPQPSPVFHYTVANLPAVLTVQLYLDFRYARFRRNLKDHLLKRRALWFHQFRPRFGRLNGFVF